MGNSSSSSASEEDSRSRREHVPEDGQTYTMYHGTSKEAAGQILACGFHQSSDGMLGRGVYVSRDLQKASKYPLNLPVQECVVLRLWVRVGKVKKIDCQEHPMQKTWHYYGYDTAWVPENCGMPQVCHAVDPLQFAYQEKVGVEDAILYMLHRAYSHLDRGGSAKFSDDTAIVGCIRSEQEEEYRSLVETPPLQLIIQTEKHVQQKAAVFDMLNRQAVLCPAGHPAVRCLTEG
ncbi:hypothetical protein GJAV_G00195520 [Gymnothorax javanicus]|nr:hypothetical protein GJAV_G00195520 [Gymnothorax javanicus]